VQGFKIGNDKCLLVLVCDGHGGPDCAAYTTQQFGTIMQDFLPKKLPDWSLALGASPLLPVCRQSVHAGGPGADAAASPLRRDRDLCGPDALRRCAGLASSRQQLVGHRIHGRQYAYAGGGHRPTALCRQRGRLDRLARHRWVQHLAQHVAWPLEEALACSRTIWLSAQAQLVACMPRSAGTTVASGKWQPHALQPCT
jgi:hypothetical protein